MCSAAAIVRGYPGGAPDRICPAPRQRLECARVSDPRRIIALLGAALMLAGAPATALAQDDPSNLPPLSPTAPGTSTPPPPPTETTPTPPPPPPAEREPAARRTQELANTGADPRVLALLGAALLLSGIGLRLRAPDGRF